MIVVSTDYKFYNCYLLLDVVFYIEQILLPYQKTEMDMPLGLYYRGEFNEMSKKFNQFKTFFQEMRNFSYQKS